MSQSTHKDCKEEINKSSLSDRPENMLSTDDVTWLHKMCLCLLQIVKGTPLLTLLKDPYILIAAGMLNNKSQRCKDAAQCIIIRIWWSALKGMRLQSATSFALFTLMWFYFCCGVLHLPAQHCWVELSQHGHRGATAQAHKETVCHFSPALHRLFFN